MYLIRHDDYHGMITNMSMNVRRFLGKISIATYPLELICYDDYDQMRTTILMNVCAARENLSSVARVIIRHFVVVVVY